MTQQVQALVVSKIRRRAVPRMRPGASAGGPVEHSAGSVERLLSPGVTRIPRGRSLLVHGRRDRGVSGDARMTAEER